MPYVKQREPDRLLRLLRGYGYATGPQLAEVLDCSPPTALARLRNPQAFTVAELRRISARGHVPLEEIRAAI